MFISSIVGCISNEIFLPLHAGQIDLGRADFEFGFGVDNLVVAVAGNPDGYRVVFGE